MADDEYFWPEEVNVGEVTYPAGGAFGPRLQRNLQLIMLHSGHMMVWIDDVPHTVPADTVCVLFPDIKSVSHSLRNARRGIVGCTSFSRNFQRHLLPAWLGYPGLCYSLQRWSTLY